MKKIAILTAKLFEDNELFYPYYRLLEAGYHVDLVGKEKDQFYESKHGAKAKSHMSIDDVQANDYDLLVIPGGYSPDHMRRSQKMVDFVNEMDRLEKPIAAICHGPWMMASSCDIKGKKITGFYSIKDDIVHAGGNFVDEEVVVDGHLITSRTPNDLPAFLKAILSALES